MSRTREALLKFHLEVILRAIAPSGAGRSLFLGRTLIVKPQEHDWGAPPKTTVVLLLVAPASHAHCG